MTHNTKTPPLPDYAVAPGEFGRRLGGHRGLVLQLGAVIERR